MKSQIFIACIMAIVLFSGCRKKTMAKPSADKSIISFAFKASDNTSVLSVNTQGEVSSDTIWVKLPAGTPLINLVPAITYTGVKLSPATGVAQDFSHPFQYTVTAEDGSTKSYTVMTRVLSTEKTITTFAFKAADNAGLLSVDANGFVGTDTIELKVPSETDLTSLTPAITFTGKEVSPQSGVRHDFSNPVAYRVLAEDGSVKTYTVIVSLNLTVFVGSNDGYLYALDGSTGKLKWKAPTGGVINSSPTVYNNGVYIGSSDGYLYVFDLVTGLLKWKRYTDGVINSTPTVANGIVYVGSNTSNNFREGFLYAIDAVNGTVKWRFYLGNGFIDASPTVSNGIVYINDSTTGYALHAIDAVTGIQKWVYQVGICRTNPAVANGIVYDGGESHTLTAIDAVTGTLKFHCNEGGHNIYSGATVSDGIVYIGAGDGYLYAFDANTGALKWKLPSAGILSGVTPGNFSSPVVSKGIVYAGNEDGYVYAADAITGALKWRYIRSGASSMGNATVAYGMVYVGNGDANLCALNALTGALKWKFQTNGPVYSGPCIIDDKGNTFHPGISGDQN